MDHGYLSIEMVHLILGVLGAINIGLNTWLVYRRAMADIREHKRNGTPDPAFEGVPKSVAQVQREGAVANDTGKK
jgi:hypothetical protein